MPIPFSTFVKRVFEAPGLSRTFVARYDGTYVGLMQLWKGGATNKLFTGLTGVK